MAEAISGIYRIEQVGTDRVYIGSSANVAIRMKKHESDLRLGKHHSPFLQRVYDRHGLSALAFWIVERCEPADLLVREQAYLDALQPAFNVAKCAEAPTRGTKLTPEHIEKLRKSSTGRRHTDEAKKKISLAHSGRIHTPETREKNRVCHLGQTPTNAQREKISRAHLGRKRSRETCEAISSALKGKKRPNTNVAAGNAKRAEWRASLTPEQIAAMRAKKSAALKAMHAARPTEYQRAITEKIAAANVGKVRSEEVRKKIRLARASQDMRVQIEAMRLANATRRMYEALL